MKSKWDVQLKLKRQFPNSGHNAPTILRLNPQITISTALKLKLVHVNCAATRHYLWMSVWWRKWLRHRAQVVACRTIVFCYSSPLRMALFKTSPLCPLSYYTLCVFLCAPGANLEASRLLQLCSATFKDLVRKLLHTYTTYFQKGKCEA